MNIDGSGAKELMRNIDQNSHPQVSPDSQWVYYSNGDGAGNRVAWRIPIDGGTPQQLTKKDGGPAILSPDGKFIFYYYRENVEGAQAKIEIVPSSGGEPTTILNAPKFSRAAGWSPDGKSIIYEKDENNVSNLWSISLDGGKERQLTNWPSEQIFWFAWSRDGKQLAVARGHLSFDLLLIKDFR